MLPVWAYIVYSQAPTGYLVAAAALFVVGLGLNVGELPSVSENIAIAFSSE